MPGKYLESYQKLIRDGLYAKFTKYFDFESFKKISYNEEVYFNPIMDELRKQQCLCLNCALMTKDKETNCSKANALYELCVANNMAMMMTRCKDFEFKKELILSENKEEVSKQAPFVKKLNKKNPSVK